ncbi:MAG: heavy metal sensor histidine kinase [Acidobacteriia bacterium]|nr:heavy metal sensor histidine kinase [Terriglobia bacterium]
MKTISMRLRLAFWYSVMLALALTLFGVSSYFAMRRSIHITVDEELQARSEGVQHLIERAFRVDYTENLEDSLREHSDLRTGGELLQVSDAQGHWLYRSEQMSQLDVPRPQSPAAKAYGLPYKDDPLRVLDRVVTAGNHSYLVQVATEMDDYNAALYRIRILLLVSIPVFLLCAAFGGYWMSRHALDPVDQIIRTAKNISVQNLSSRLEVPRTGDELQRLSETLNGMLERLETAFKKITQFTADASHELRTPVAVMRTRAELSLRRARSVEDYRDTVAQIHSELERTTELIEKLMFLARTDSGAESIPFARVDLSKIVHEVDTQGSALAEGKHVSFRENLPGHPVWVQGDEHLLRRLFLILIDNAVKYTPSEGTVEVSIMEQNGTAIGQIRDTGIGVAAADLPNIFERFYRADKARSRETGGTGLGLSIGKWIAEAHAGTIEVESAPGQGSTFQVRLPISKNGG